MKPQNDCLGNIDAMKQLLLDMAQERSVDAVLNLVVERLTAVPEVALARIWLVRPGDICAECHLLTECPDHSACLHLVASAGKSRVNGAAWNRLEGVFRRFPLGVRKVGHIARTGQPLEIPDITGSPGWLADSEWARREGIRAFGGQPLIFKGEVLGVLAIFARTCLGEENLIWLRMIANHAATAIANARAFEEIARLKDQLERERDYLRDEVSEARSFGDIIGASPSLRNVIRQIELVAQTDASVLILGESGTGKELVAREIHKRSARRDRPMVKVNCASVPRELYESEFFGHVKGAFTGAVSDRTGRFELADGGTLFLDEVGEIPIELQSKLLRVLQEGEFEKVGADRTQRVDVRIVSATNRDLRQEIEAGRFREDLYYRLNVFPIEVAPLRRRPEDIPLLAAHFVEQSARRLNLPRPRLTQEGVRRLQAYAWPGNVRELQNVIERAVITARAGRLEFDLPGGNGLSSPLARPAKTASPEVAEEEDVLTEVEMEQRMRDNLIAALRKTNWKIAGAGGAAELLGIKPTTLNSRIKKLGIRREVER